MAAKGIAPGPCVSRPMLSRGAVARPLSPLVGTVQGGQAAAVPRLALRLREAAEALSVSDRWLHSQVKAGRVPVAKVGGVTLFPVVLLQEWLRSEATKPQTSGSELKENCHGRTD